MSEVKTDAGSLAQQDMMMTMAVFLRVINNFDGHEEYSFSTILFIFPCF